MTAQISAIFAFAVVITGVVALGIPRAREINGRLARVRAQATDKRFGRKAA